MPQFRLPRADVLINSGVLWRIDADLSKHAMLRDITVPNGIGCKPEI